MGRGFVRQEKSTKTYLKGWPEGLLAAGLTVAPVLVVLTTVPATRAAHTAAQIVGMMAGGLMLLAALLFFFHWLTTPSRRHSWTVTAMLVLAVQVLVSSGHELASPPPDQHMVLLWGNAIDLLAITVVIGLMLLGARAVRNPQPLLLGIGLAVALTLLHMSGLVDPLPFTSSAAAAGVVLLLIVAAHLVVAWLVLRDHNLVEWARNRLALTVALIGVAHIARSGAFEGLATDLAASLALASAAGIWASTTFLLLRDAMSTQHRRSIVLEGSLLEIESSLRGSREQLHEIRSTVAGAAGAFRLLDDTTIGAPTRARLERAIGTELDRLERLVSPPAPAVPGPVDLDSTLDVLLESHRARGHVVEWEPTGGAAVHARPDDVAEALNILLDNAATHGGTASRVAVTRDANSFEIAVTDEGPGVAPEEREGIFEWGVHGSDSPGEGIGLSVARRLVSEHGGTLTLADAGANAAPGSSFIIRLPAARRSED
ncbi:MAG: HAMP domain-containing sensor histidine kinase [Nocardioides sp.]|uniref:sensor histidine kinase n=1 Tax=Nocardioides sp. TaxID=35761 RepID=UPI00326761A4